MQIQCRVWYQADIAHQQESDPVQYRYYQAEDGKLLPVTTEVLPAPKAIIEMVRCQCNGNCLAQRCSCRAKSLPCTDLCLCGTECQNDQDLLYTQGQASDDSDDELL